MTRQGKPRPRTVETVKEFWNKEAEDWGNDPRVTIRDHYFRLLEIDTVVPFVKGKRKVLDIGCGTGFSSLFYAEAVGKLIAADYAEAMISKAQQFLSDPAYFDLVMSQYAPDRKPRLVDNLSFEAGNILDLKYGDAVFDAVVAERVLINLPSVDQQEQAVAEVSRVLKSGGLWILVEVTQQGHGYVDKLREKFGLGKIEKYWHNLYLDEQGFEEFVSSVGFSLRKKLHFETYQFLTKVVHPFIVRPAEPEFMSGYNNATRIVAAQYPLCQNVGEVGLGKFLRERFRPLVFKHDPGKLKEYDEALPVILESNPDFTRCSHQVLYVLEKS